MKIRDLFLGNLDPDIYRKDFSFLERKRKGKQVIYFDNACMPPRPEKVLEESKRYYDLFPGCAGRSNHLIAKNVEEEVEKVRESVAEFFGAESPKEVVFTKNTTEAINLVANGLKFNSGDVVLVSDKEHNSNLIPWLRLQKKGIIKLDIVYSNGDNTFSLINLEKKLHDYNGAVRLVSFAYTSNLDGVTLPAKEIMRLTKRYKAKVMFDCAQAASHHDININKLGADFIACSSHKLLGPNGVGALISTKENLEQLEQFIVGGETVKDSTFNLFVPEDIPARFEAGLQNYPGIIGFGAALKYIESIGRTRIHKQLTELNNRATEGLAAIPKVKILGPEADKRSGILSFVIEGKNVHEVALLLSNGYSIMVRSGAHCVHSWFNKPEVASGPFKDGTIRASFGFYNTFQEVDEFLKAVGEISKL